MFNEPLPNGPTRDELIGLIRERWPDAAIAETEGAIFFSLDDKHWPNFATVVWTDDFDEGSPSILTDREDAYRVNFSLDPATYRRLVGSVTDVDQSAFDTLIPHPVYAKQRWVSILNPSHASLATTVMPLISDAHDRLVARAAAQAGT